MTGTSSSWSRIARTAPLAASPASFQPSNATTSSDPPEKVSVSMPSAFVSVTAVPPCGRGRVRGALPQYGDDMRSAGVQRSAQGEPARREPRLGRRDPSHRERCRADLPAGVFWDMDGTLVDTEPYWLTAETALVESYGGTWSTEDGLQLVGSSLERSAIILQSRGVGARRRRDRRPADRPCARADPRVGAVAARSARAALGAARRRDPDRPRHDVDRPDGGARRRGARVHRHSTRS